MRTYGRPRRQRVPLLKVPRALNKLLRRRVRRREPRARARKRGFNFLASQREKENTCRLSIATTSPATAEIFHSTRFTESTPRHDVRHDISFFRSDIFREHFRAEVPPLPSSSALPSARSVIEAKEKPSADGSRVCSSWILLPPFRTRHLYFIGKCDGN